MFICPFGTKKNFIVMLPLAIASVGMSALSAIQQQSNYDEEVRLRKEFFEQDFQNQLDLMRTQNKYNSPSNQVSMMRAAGLNPDNQSISAQPSASASLPSAQDMFVQIPNTVQTAADNLMRGLPQVMSFMSNFLDLQRKDVENKGIASQVATQIARDQMSMQPDVYSFLSGVMSPEDIKTLQELPIKDRMSYIGGNDAALAMSPVSGKDIPDNIKQYYIKSVERAISSPDFYTFYWNTISKSEDANIERAYRKVVGKDLSTPEPSEDVLSKSFVKYLELIYQADKARKLLEKKQTDMSNRYYDILGASGYASETAERDVNALGKEGLIADVESKLAGSIDSLINSDKTVEKALGFLAYYMVFGQGANIANGMVNKGVNKLF